MSLILISLMFLMALSIFLVIVEIFFIPGTTLFGIVGGIGVFVSIYFAFQESIYFGAIALCMALVFFLIFFILGKKMMNKSKLNLKSSLTEKVFKVESEGIKIGQSGVTISVLKPNGKAIFNHTKVEVYSLGNYIEKDVEVVVINIEENKIFVNPLN